MTASGVVQLALYLVVLLALVKPLGAYMARRWRSTLSAGSSDSSANRA